MIIHVLSRGLTEIIFFHKVHVTQVNQSTVLDDRPLYVHLSQKMLSIAPSYLHLRRDIGLEEGEYKQNCLYATVLCTIVMVYNSMNSFYR